MLPVKGGTFLPKSRFLPLPTVFKPPVFISDDCLRVEMNGLVKPLARFIHPE